MGYGLKGYTVFLIDFGLSTRFVDSKHNHIPFATGKRLIGTPWYCSIPRALTPGTAFQGPWVAPQGSIFVGGHATSRHV